MKANYLTSGELMAKYPALMINLINACDLGSFVRLELDGYYNTTLRRIVILESEVKELLHFIKEGLIRKKARAQRDSTLLIKQDQPSYLTSEELLRKYPKLSINKVVPSDITMMARIQAVDAHLDSTVKKLVILESDVDRILKFIKQCIERKKNRRFGLI